MQRRIDRIGVAIPAAGTGRRMGGRKKPWLTLLGDPLLLHTLRPFLAHPGVAAVRVAVAAEEAAEPPDWLVDVDPRVEVVPGGETRAHSVREAIRSLPEVELVMVHDAARPLVTGALLVRLEKALLLAPEVVGTVAGRPATDTLKEVDETARVVATPDRSRLWHAQTPQLFRAAELRSLYERLEELTRDGPVTDDASLVEAAGLGVRMVEGEADNIKVTRPADIPLAEFYLRLRREASEMGVNGGLRATDDDEGGGR